MARIFMDGFESGFPNTNIHNISNNTNGGSLWTATYSRGSGSFVNIDNTVADGNNSVRSTRIRVYNSSFSTRSGFGAIRRDLPTSYDKLYCKLDFRFDTNRSEHSIVILRSEGTDRMSIRVPNTSGNRQLRLYNGTTSVATSDPMITAGVWTRLEFMYDNATGNIQVRLNGLLIFNYTGTLTGSVDRIDLGMRSSVSISGRSTEYDARFDNICINDDTGDVNNSWVGGSAIILRSPDGDGHHKNFTPNTGVGDNFDKINTYPFSSTNYVENIDGFGEKDTYTLPELPAGTEVNAIQTLWHARYIGDFGSMRDVMRIGTTDYVGDTKLMSLVLQDRMESQIHNVNPATSAQWTKSDVDDLEAGFEQVDSGGV